MSAELVSSRLSPGSRHTFGRGSAEPYARALAVGQGKLSVLDVSGAVPAVHYRVQDWLVRANDFERSLLRGARGPVLDIGCGPGRMLVAAEDLGLAAYGVDSNPLAAARARSQGATVFEQSIFDPLPGDFQTLLLLDGNIGIGGDPQALLGQLLSIAAPGARLIVETDPLKRLEARYQAILVDSAGRSSETFDWARLGSEPLHRHAADAGWTLLGSVERGGRRVSLLGN